MQNTPTIFRAVLSSLYSLTVFLHGNGRNKLISSIERTSISNGSSRNAGFFSPAEIGICRVQNPLVAQHTKECIHKIDHIGRNKCEDP